MSIFHAMTSRKVPLPSAKSATATFYDHSNDPWFKNQSIESSGVTVESVPVYLKQQGEFGDDGAFPDSNYIKYIKPSSLQKSARCAKERTKRMMEISLDPLDPAKLKRKRVPKASGSLPVPVVYLPSRPDVTVKNQQEDWTIPPCISNWENPEGYAIPLAKRLAAYERRLYDVEVSNNFAKVSQVLNVAEERAREAISMRLEVQKERERREQELRAGAARGDYECDGDANTEPTCQTET